MREKVDKLFLVLEDNNYLDQSIGNEGNGVSIRDKIKSLEACIMGIIVYRGVSKNKEESLE